MSEDSGPYQVPLPVSIAYITDHFRWQEFDSHDGADMPDEVKPNLRRLCANVLEVIREQWNEPIIVVSGWRSRNWNFKVGGALGSKHLTGEAADIRPVSLGDMSNFAAKIGQMINKGQLPALGGFGRYKHWIHVDCRMRKPDGSIARWDGKGVGSEFA